MNSKLKKQDLTTKEYLFLAVSLFLFFLFGAYVYLFRGTIPEDISIIFVSIICIFIAIPITIYILKKLIK